MELSFPKAIWTNNETFGETLLDESISERNGLTCGENTLNLITQRVYSPCLDLQQSTKVLKKERQLSHFPPWPDGLSIVTETTQLPVAAAPASCCDAGGCT